MGLSANKTTDSLKLYSARYDKEKIASASDEERVVFFTLAQINNDIFMLQRATLIYLQSDDDEKDPIAYARTSTALLFAELLAGKLYEASRFLTTVAAHSKLVATYAPVMPAASGDTLKRIRMFFNDTNTLTNRIRNKTAFHYDYEPMASAYAAFPADESFVDYFAEAETNSFYQGAAQIAAFAATGAKRKEDLRPALDALMMEVLDVSRWVKDYAHAFMEAFLKRHVEENLENLLNQQVITLDGLPRLNDVRAPYFCWATKSQTEKR